MLPLITIYFQDLMLSYHSVTRGKLDIAFEGKKIEMKFFNTSLLFYIIFRIELLEYLSLISNCSLSNLFPPSSPQRLNLFYISGNDRPSSIHGHLSYVSVLYNSYFSNTDIWFFITYYNFS